jgi:CheY-like chemotaxis protein
LQQRAEALEEANVHLQELDRLKDRFLANMSHELRTPLNSIIGFSEVLVDGLVGEMTPEQKGCLKNIRSGGHHLLALINDILDISKIEAGRMELEPTTFDVAGLLAEVEVTITPLIEKKSQVLKVEQAGGLPHLTADRFRIKQVLLNLLSNGYKFAPVEGHITLSCRLVDQTTMLFSVADTGIGIKPEDQEMIFEEFRQADGSPEQEMTGTGLGLAISKRLVEMHGGRIWVESKEPGVAGGTEQSSDGKTVLVVEDDRQFSDLLAFYLRREGYTPVQYYNGVGVLDHARRLKPALVTLDVMLPDLDGWDVLRALKSDPLTKDIPVLVISVLENSELAFSLGAVDYLIKPVRRDDLHRVLGQLAAPAPPDRGVKVLVVDDDPGVVLLLRRMLPAGRYTLLPAYDGEQGLVLARSEHPDVVLLDLLMPGMSGFEVLEVLRADVRTSAIPVIVLTAKDVTPGERKLLNEHVQGLVRKSALTPQSLLAELRRLEALAATPGE